MPSDDASVAKVWVVAGGTPAVLNLLCNSIYLVMYMTFPASGGMDLMVRDGLNPTTCQDASIFTNGFESGSTSHWKMVK